MNNLPNLPKLPSLSDARGLGKLLVDTTVGMTDALERVHKNMLAPAAVDLVYDTIRSMTRTVGEGVDVVLAQLPQRLGTIGPSAEREAVLSVLNGLLGDRLRASDNPLFLPMHLRREGKPLTLTHDALTTAIPQASTRLVVLAHGHCMSDLQWSRNGHNHGTAIAARHGYTDVYLRYCSGLHISDNGRNFSDLLETLLDQWPTPVQELVLLGYSMGGLVVRSACHYGQQSRYAWPRRLRTLVTIGTPHHGSHLERANNWLGEILGVHPYTAVYAELTKFRSEGSTDLGYGNLLDEDWQGRDRFAVQPDTRRIVPLPDHAACYAIGGAIAPDASDPDGRIFGDGVVLLPSALGQHKDPARCVGFPAEHREIVYGVHHLDLLDSRKVSAALLQWLQPRDISSNHLPACAPCPNPS